MLLLYYSDVKNLDRKPKGKVNNLMTAYLFLKKDGTISIDFYAVEILLRQKHPKIEDIFVLEYIKIIRSNNQNVARIFVP
jgi:hypothetical protein